MSGPILVTGADRSGTTLLYTLLASHPSIMMVRRTNLWRWFDGRFGDLADPENLARCLDVMTRYQRLSVLSPDPDAIRAEFAAGPPGYGRLFEILFAQQAARMGLPRWGDKSLHTELQAGRVFSEWPQARMIQVVRDPRDRFASVVGRAGPGSERRASIVGRWLRSTRAAVRNARRYPGRYLVLRYEDLVADPWEHTRRVCQFLGVEFEPAMMEMRGGDDRSREGGNSSFEELPPGVISTRSVGRYRQALEPGTVAFIETLCRPLMRRFGYTLDSPRPGAMGSIRHLGDAAGGAVRVLAWLVRERYGELRRRRSVPDHRLAEAGGDG